VPHVAVVRANRRDVGPCRRRLVRQAAVDGIDAEREQRVELGCRARAFEARRQQIPVERLEMAEVEREAMSLGDRSLEQSAGGNQVEQRVGAAPRLGEAREKETARGTGMRAGLSTLGDCAAAPVAASIRQSSATLAAPRIGSLQ